MKRDLTNRVNAIEVHLKAHGDFGSIQNGQVSLRPELLQFLMDRFALKVCLAN